MALPLGSWMGTNVTVEDIAYLRSSRRLPREMEVAVRLPRGKQRQQP